MIRYKLIVEEHRVSFQHFDRDEVVPRSAAAQPQLVN